jgi:ubiquinone/menaquinone biosynthesis C-methylase UbiE
MCNVEYGLPLVDDSIEEVYCSHTIEHLNDVVKFLTELGRVCKEGGLIVLRMPYYSYKFALNPSHNYTFCDEWFVEIVRNSYPELFSIEMVEYKECAGVRDELLKYGFEFEFAKKHFNNVVEDFTIYLRVVKKHPYAPKSPEAE